MIGDADGGIPSFLGQQRPPTYATTFVATGSADGAVRLWKAPAIAHMRQQSGWKCTQTLEAHGGTVTSITGAPGLLVTGSTDRSVKLWRAVEGRRGATLYPWYDLSKTLTVLGSWITSLSYSTTHNVGDLGWLYVSEDTGDVHVFRGRHRVVSTAAASPTAPGSLTRALEDAAGAASGGGGGLALQVHVDGLGGAGADEEHSGGERRWEAHRSSMAHDDIDFERNHRPEAHHRGWAPAGPASAADEGGGGGRDWRASQSNLAWRRAGLRGVSKIIFISSYDLVITLCNDNCMRIYDVKGQHQQHAHAQQAHHQPVGAAAGPGPRPPSPPAGSAAPEGGGYCQTVIENEHSCNFSDMEYDPMHTQVLLSDKFGYLYIYCIEERKMIFQSRVLRCAIRKVHLRLSRPPPAIAMMAAAHAGAGPAAAAPPPPKEEVLLLTETGVHFCSIERDLQYYQFPTGHSGPVIAVHATGEGPDDAAHAGPALSVSPSGKHLSARGAGGMEPGDEGEDVAPRIYSASLDNTVRVWDPYDFSCLRILEETDSEISSMCLSGSRGTIITGHDDGCVRVWEVDTGRCVARYSRRPREGAFESPIASRVRY